MNFDKQKRKTPMSVPPNPKVLSMRADALAACATMRNALSGQKVTLSEATDALGFLSALESVLANPAPACELTLYHIEHKKPPIAAEAAAA